MCDSSEFKPKLQQSRSLAFAVLAGACAIAMTTGAARCEERVAFSDSVKPLPMTAGSRVEQAAPDLTASMEFMIALKMRDFNGLLARVGADAIIPPAEMAEKYFPLPADYNSMSDWLSGQGFAITGTDPNRLCIFARGTAAQIQQAMQVSFSNVSADGKQYLSASAAPSLPALVAAPVLGINGLQPHIHKHVHSRSVPMNSAGAASRAVNSPPFFPSQILKAYGAAGVTVTGAGQTIGIVIDTPPATSDLTAFWSQTGVAQSLNNITFVQAVQGRNAAPSGEETLDTEWSSSIAPNSKVRVYVTTDLSDVNIDKGYQAIIADLPNQPTLKQVSCSFGSDETQEPASQMNTDAQFFATMASNGVSIFVSTGDDGSTPDRVTQISSPSNDPSVTAVGGTSIVLNSSGGVSSETVWSGSGGGTSSFFARPSFQTGNGVPAGSFRLNPDVSSAADPNTGCLVILGGQQMQYGGTSWSAPTWAGICALINEARTSASLPAAGLLGPKIYPLIGSASFRDITSGSNGAYSATVGFDECTGIGTPNIANLVNALSNGNGGGGGGPGAPTITTFTPTSGPVGTTVIVTGTNFASPLTVSFNGATASASQVTPTQAMAQVPAGATTGPIAVTTSAGTATSAVNFTVTSGGGGGSGAPTISAFTPTSGPVGTTVTVTGTNFASPLTVSFNGASASATQVTPTQATVQVPAGATTGPIAVTTSAGTATSAANFTVTSGALPSASVAASTATADANANTHGVFTVTLSTSSRASVTVNYTIGGTAVSGVDFKPLSGSVVVSGNRTTASVTVTPLFNANATGPSTVVLTLAAGSGYGLSNSQSATVTVENIPGAPQFTSPAQATPNPAFVGQAIAFSAVATTATSDTLTVTWDFGDGTTGTGSNVTKTYLTTGTFTAVVTAADNKLTVSSSVAVTVNAAQPMQISTLLLKFNFRSPGHDSLTVTGTLPLGPGYMPNGDDMTLSIGSFSTDFPLNARGSSASPGQSFVLSGKLKQGQFTNSVLKFTLRLANQDLFDALNPSPGFSQTANASGVAVPILFTFNNNAFTGTRTVNYVTNGKTGTAK